MQAFLTKLLRKLSTFIVRTAILPVKRHIVYDVNLLSKLAVHKTIKDYAKSQQNNIGILKPPKIIFVFGGISMLIWSVFMIVSLLFTKDTMALTICTIVFGSLFALGLFLVVYQRNFMMIYKDGEIIYRNIFHVVHKFNCQDIEHTYYTNTGGIKLIFKDGRKLKFDKEESYFYKEIVEKEHLKCQFEWEECSTITICLHPFLMCLLWCICGGMVFILFLYDFSLSCTILMFVFCLGYQMSSTTYDKESKILTRKKCGFSKKYDMHFCSAKPVYDGNALMMIEIYEKNKKVAKIPASREYKNRERMVQALCKVKCEKSF